MDHSFGGTNLLHLRALPRQDTRNQNGAARMVAQGLASVNQLDRSKFEWHCVETRKSKLENQKSKIENRKPKTAAIFEFRFSSFEFPAHI